MHLLKMLGARERGSSDSDRSEEDLAGCMMDMALQKLSSHSIYDTYPCRGLKSIDDYMSYDVPPFVSKFSVGLHSEHIFAVASEEGEITILNSSKRHDQSFLTKFTAHNNAIFDICWVSDEPKFVTASGDSTAALWDVSSGKKLAEFAGHRSSVKTISFKPLDKCVFATGSRDGCIIVWDTRRRPAELSYHADNILRNVHQISGSGNTPKQRRQFKSSNNESVTAVIFQDDNTLISAGVGDGLIKMWDLRKSYSAYKNDPLPKCVLSYPGRSIKKVGYSSLVLDSSHRRLFASCTDSTIYEFNCAAYDGKHVLTYQGHLNSTYFVKSSLSPCDRYLLSGSSDNNAYIWKVGISGKAMYQLSGHNEEVTSVDWCQSSIPKIVTCSDDKTFRIWQLATEGDQNNELQLKHGIVEKLEVKVDTSHHITYKTPHSSKSTPAKITPQIMRKCLTSPLQDVHNINSSEYPSSPYSSPTQNLPNLVMDRILTPDSATVCGKRKLSNFRKMDWLTEFSTKFQQQSCVERKRSLTLQKSTSVKKRRKLKPTAKNNHKASKCLENYYK